MSTPLHLQSLPAAVVGFWWLYLLECKGGVFYAGITNDLARRYRAHASGSGARFTRARPPLQVVAMKPYPDRPAALRAEWAVKRLPRARKLAFFTGAI